MNFVRNIALGTALALLLAGCGGSSGSSATGPRSQGAMVAIRWPSRTRMIPNNANSIRITLVRQDQVVAGTAVRTRPSGEAAQNEDRIAFNDLEAGEYSATAEVFADTQAPASGGLALARGTASFTVVPGEITTFNITLGSRVNAFRIEQGPLRFLLHGDNKFHRLETSVLQSSQSLLVSANTGSQIVTTAVRWTDDDGDNVIDLSEIVDLPIEFSGNNPSVPELSVQASGNMEFDSITAASGANTAWQSQRVVSLLVPVGRTGDIKVTYRDGNTNTPGIVLERIFSVERTGLDNFTVGPVVRLENGDNQYTPSLVDISASYTVGSPGAMMGRPRHRLTLNSATSSFEFGDKTFLPDYGNELAPGRIASTGNSSLFAHEGSSDLYFENPFQSFPFAGDAPVLDVAGHSGKYYSVVRQASGLTLRRYSIDAGSYQGGVEREWPLTGPETQDLSLAVSFSSKHLYLAAVGAIGTRAVRLYGFNDSGLIETLPSITLTDTVQDIASDRDLVYVLSNFRVAVYSGITGSPMGQISSDLREGNFTPRRIAATLDGRVIVVGDDPVHAIRTITRS